MRKLQKITALILALFCLQVPTASATTVDVQETDSMELHVEYMEFYNNQQYYKDLAKNEGYTIIINVGEEYADLENERIANEAVQIDELVSEKQTRDGTPPTQPWNVLTQGTKGFSGTATNSICYTKFLYCGCTSYEVSIYNSSPHNTLYFRFYNTGDGTTYSLSTGTSVIKYVALNPETKFYLGFDAPGQASGYVARDI